MSEELMVSLVAPVSHAVSRALTSAQFRKFAGSTRDRVARQHRHPVLQERGNGLVVSDQEGRTVKASSIARDFSKAQLEKRFGSFEVADKHLQAAQVERVYKAQPVLRDSGTDALYQRYLAEQGSRRSARAQIRQELRAQERSLVSQAKNRAKLRPQRDQATRLRPVHETYALPAGRLGLARGYRIHPCPAEGSA